MVSTFGVLLEWDDYFVVCRVEGLANEERCCSRFDRERRGRLEWGSCSGPFLLLAILKIDADIMVIVVAIARCQLPDPLQLLPGWHIVAAFSWQRLRRNFEQLTKVAIDRM
jgi:hypothetical protein